MHVFNVFKSPFDLAPKKSDYANFHNNWRNTLYLFSSFIVGGVQAHLRDFCKAIYMQVSIKKHVGLHCIIIIINKVFGI